MRRDADGVKVLLPCLSDRLRKPFEETGKTLQATLFSQGKSGLKSIVSAKPERRNRSARYSAGAVDQHHLEVHRRSVRLCTAVSGACRPLIEKIEADVGAPGPIEDLPGIRNVVSESLLTRGLRVVAVGDPA